VGPENRLKIGRLLGGEGGIRTLGTGSPLFRSNIAQKWLSFSRQIYRQFGREDLGIEFAQTSANAGHARDLVNVE